MFTSSTSQSYNSTIAAALILRWWPPPSSAYHFNNRRPSLIRPQLQITYYEHCHLDVPDQMSCKKV
ncbi:hypothetical protein M378DRAFT_165910 [Amanita muscaria Koide BX008]|uniref:Uncharacterized protein n=1 Tax=Amanita muscaria (strain Koide BX008) TaxID=946122 RepID=A0A0C2WLB4_AMAMK|nr:hypothetical protein M378DRAFT_165910 [Amanita muscaria Koide BX008]